MGIKLCFICYILSGSMADMDELAGLNPPVSAFEV